MTLDHCGGIRIIGELAEVRRRQVPVAGIPRTSRSRKKIRWPACRRPLIKRDRSWHDRFPRMRKGRGRGRRCRAISSFGSLPPTKTCAKNPVYRFGAIDIGMFGQNPPARSFSDFPCGLPGQAAKQGSHVLSVARDQHLLARLQKDIDAFPIVGNEASPGASRLETRVAGEKPFSAMLARDMLRTAIGVTLKAL